MNRDYPNTPEGIKSISIAYQTLSDPQLRYKYNTFGHKESAPEGGFLDPEDVFGTIIGGQRFLPVIGELTLARDLKAAFLREADAAEGDDAATPVQRDDKGRKIISPEEEARRHEKSLKLGSEVRLHGGSCSCCC
jgi:DnaJ-class molecular chaperone